MMESISTKLDATNLSDDDFASKEDNDGPNKFNENNLSQDTNPSFTNETIKQFLTQLCGYICDEDSSVTDTARIHTDDSIEAFHRFQKKQLRKDRAYCQSDSASFIFAGSHVMTQTQLRKEMELALDAAQGRLSLNQFKICLCIDNDSDSIFIDTIAKDLIKSQEIERIFICSSGDVILLSSRYWDSWIEQELKIKLKKSGGRLRLSDLACHLGLPPNVVLSNLNKRENPEQFYAACILGDGSTYVVSKDYLDMQKDQVNQKLSSAIEPINIDDLIREMEWNGSSAYEHILDLCHSQILNGGLQGSFYIPQIYEDNQRKLIYDFLTANGYITMQYCRTIIGVSSEMKVREYIDETYVEKERLVFVGSVFINQDVILLPLETAIQDCKALNSFVDLKIHLPEEFISSLENDADCVDILKTIFSKNNDGIVISSGQEIMFFSNEMIQQIIEIMMPELIRQHAQQAVDATKRELINRTNDNATERYDSDLDGKSKSAPVSTRKNSKKSGGKGEKSRKKNSASKIPRKENRKTKDNDDDNIQKQDSKKDIFASFVPLSNVAIKIATAYPSLHALQEKYEPPIGLKESSSLEWENDMDDAQSLNDGPLYDFCRVALDTPALREKCSKAIQEEIVKFQSLKRIQEQKMRVIQKSFEDTSCYDTACYMIQLLSRLPNSLLNGKTDGTSCATLLQQDFLTGFGSFFARKITEYSVFKHGFEGFFHFHPLNENKCMTTEKIDENLPDFCLPIEVSTRMYEGAFLSCSKANIDTESSDPLKLLREQLPRDVGKNLARMWALCGGLCYESGEMKSDEVDTTKKGNFSAFLKHVREHSKSMVGKEFKKIEKKVEKQLLFKRRQELSKCLEYSSDPVEILDITIMLLFQQMKGVVIAGSELKGAVLAQLVKERNIPVVVKDNLAEMTELLRKNEAIPTQLIESVRKYGLMRNLQTMLNGPEEVEAD